MKKHTLLFIVLVSSIIVAQENEEKFPQDINKKHEVKINAFNLLAFDWLDVSYEYLINEESSFGIGALISFNRGNNSLDFYRKSSLTPFYRRYFSNKFARGFFVEGFGIVHSYEKELYDGTYINTDEDIIEFAVGISVGGKFISKRGFTTEIYLGLGRNLAGDYYSLEVVGRGGVSLGYRF